MDRFIRIDTDINIGLDLLANNMKTKPQTRSNNKPVVLDAIETIDDSIPMTSLQEFQQLIQERLQHFDPQQCFESNDPYLMTLSHLWLFFRTKQQAKKNETIL